jgi:hypothetical protein
MDRANLASVDALKLLAALLRSLTLASRSSSARHSTARRNGSRGRKPTEAAAGLREARRNASRDRAAEAATKSAGLRTIGGHAARDNAGGARARTASLVAAVAVGTSRWPREAAGNAGRLNTSRSTRGLTGGQGTWGGLRVAAKL